MIYVIYNMIRPMFDFDWLSLHDCLSYPLVTSDFRFGIGKGG